MGSNENSTTFSIKGAEIQSKFLKTLPASTSSWVAKGAVLLLLTAAWLTPVSAGADTAVPETGSIHGNVLVTRKLAEERMRFRLYPGFKPIPAPAPGEMRDDQWHNIVIYLKSIRWVDTPSDLDRVLKIEQQGETFIPHVLPVLKGSSVEFPNQDPIFHNVFSLSGTNTFDLGRYPTGESKSVTFDKAGIVPVFCHLHSDMSAIILVLDNPFFAVPGTDGKYQIDNIPPGTYTLVAWHERSEQIELQVEVVQGQATELNLTVPITDDDLPES